MSLEVRKIYEVLDDERAARHELLRVIDESGEDYLFPRALFVPIDVPDALSHVVGEPRSGRQARRRWEWVIAHATRGHCHLARAERSR